MIRKLYPNKTVNNNKKETVNEVNRQMTRLGEDFQHLGLTKV